MKFWPLIQTYIDHVSKWQISNFFLFTLERLIYPGMYLCYEPTYIGNVTLNMELQQ